MLNAAFDAALAREPRLVAFGEDVGRLGDVNQAFRGLQEKYGPLRVSDTGIRELTIGNAIMLSSFRKQTVEMPFDEEAYEALLQELIRTSRYQKTIQEQVITDLEKSFHA